MKRFLALGLLLLFTLQVLASPRSQCQSLLNWLYKDLTIKNFELSYERAMNKFLVGLISAHKNTKSSMIYHDEFTELANNLKAIEPGFRRYIEPNLSVWLGSIFQTPLRSFGKNNMHTAFQKLRELQKNSPELFKGLEKEFYLDDWDLFTIDNLARIDELELDSAPSQSKLDELSQKLNASHAEILSNKKLNINDIKNLINSLQNSLVEDLNKGTLDLLNDFKNICTDDELKLLLNEQYACPLIEINNQDDLSHQLGLISSVLGKTKLLEQEKPKNLIKVNPVKYKTSNDPRSTYCKRPEEMISTLVIHHTDTSGERTPHDINQMHLDNRTPAGEPWYMVGYNFMVSTHYSGATVKNPKVFQGRKNNIKGAHAGGYSAPLSDKEKAFYNQFEIECGNDTIGWTKGSPLDQLDNEGGISGNLVSLGIAVIGDFSPFKYEMIDGVMTPLNPASSEYQKPTQEQLDTTARLACDLQKQHPNIKTIVPHSYYKETDCPGAIINDLSVIRDMAAKYGCQFSVKYTKAEGNK